MAKCGRMVSAMVTMESPQETTIALSFGKHSLYADKFTRLFYLFIQQLLQAANLVGGVGTLGSDLMFYCRFFLFLLPQYLRAHSADCCETLPNNHYLGVLYNPSPKIWGRFPNNLGPKACETGSILPIFRLSSSSSMLTPKYLQNHSVLDDVQGADWLFLSGDG